MSPLSIVLTRILKDVGLLLFILIVLLTLFGLSYFNLGSINNFKTRILKYRFYLLSLCLVVTTTIVYWFFDTYIINLPDPVLPFAFYILVFTIYFGWKITAVTAILSILLIEYYLFEPRYDFNPQDHFINSIFALIGAFASFYIGYKIRGYQERLLQNTEDLKQLIKARDQFASIAAHDLKTPLTIIKLYAQNLNKKYGDKHASSKIYSSVESINRESDKLLTMINRLLDFSKLQSGKFQFNFEIIDLYTLIRGIVKNIKTIYPQHKFNIKSKIKKAEIVADEIAIERIITNLLTNAVKYSETKTKIEIKISSTKDSFIISIKDHGIGIEQKNIDKLFEPFYQTSDTNQGLGLGLFITKRLVELQKGLIQIKSKPHKGSTFILRFPKTSYL